MDSAKKHDLLNKHMEKYKTMVAAKKEEFRNRNKNTVVINVKAWIHALIHLKRKLRKVHIIYVVCAIGCSIRKISNRYPSQHLFDVQISFDGKIYICNTCHSKAIQGKVPCQATVNNYMLMMYQLNLKVLKNLRANYNSTADCI